MIIHCKKVLSGFLFLVVLNLPVNAANSEPNRDHEIFVRTLINSMEKLFSENYSRNPDLTERFLFILDKVDKNEVKFRISSSMPRSIFGGMSFNFTVEPQNSQLPFFEISDYFIEIYKKYPSVTFAVLFHEFQHAYNYFKDTEQFRLGKKNKLEEYLFEMDADFMEAMFIRDILKPSSLTLSKFENFILESLSKDQLNMASILLRKTNMSMVYQLHQFQDLDATREKKIANIEDIGKSLIDPSVLSADDTEEIKYLKLVAMYTYTMFIPQFLYNIEYASNKMKVSDFKLENYEKIHNYLKNMDEVLKNNSEFINTNYLKIRKSFSTLEM